MLWIIEWSKHLKDLRKPTNKIYVMADLDTGLETSCVPQSNFGIINILLVHSQPGCWLGGGSTKRELENDIYVVEKKPRVSMVMAETEPLSSQCSPAPH